MTILGIDPGIASVGFAVLTYKQNKFTVHEFGTFKTAPKQPLSNRLLKISEFLDELTNKYSIDAFSVEKLFFNTNTTTAIDVAQGRGVILLAAAKKGIEVYEYTPLQVKMAVVGYGRADKKQVQAMVKTILNLKEVPRPDDTADACAIAICQAHSAGSTLMQRLR